MEEKNIFGSTVPIFPCPGLTDCRCEFLGLFSAAPVCLFCASKRGTLRMVQRTQKGTDKPKQEEGMGNAKKTGPSP